MDQLVFYFTAILFGILLYLFLETLINAIKRKAQPGIEETDSVPISDSHIQDCILPNNKGKSIDRIIDNLKTNNVDPHFSVDSLFHQGGKD